MHPDPWTGGEIGRRASLRSWWSNPCGFESRPVHIFPFFPWLSPADSLKFPDMLRFSIRFALLLASAASALAAGSENFNNFPETGSTHNSGTFIGQDGSTWTYVKCRGNKVINAPTPGLAKGEIQAASVSSGPLAGGCGTLSFDWMQMFTSSVNLDVRVNDTVRYTVTGGVQNVTNHVGPISINSGGNFTLKFQQHDLQAGQVAIDNVVWTSYGGSAPEPPAIIFSPDTNSILTAYSNVIRLTVTATEPNVDTVRLWASGLPPGAAFAGATGAAPLIASFSWTPSAAQTGFHSVVFYAGDKDGTNSRAFSIEVTPIYPYYHYAEGLTGPALKAKLHDIISTGAHQLTDTGSNNELDRAMKDIHTDPTNPDNVLLLYNPTSSLPKSAYNAPGGWNKEHCWLNSHGLENGPDGVDVHNLYAESIGVNSLRNNLLFDESDPADPDYQSPATNTAPLTSMDGDSWAPPPGSKGNVARAVFYMATRYDGSEPDTTRLELSDTPNDVNQMGILTTLLAWHAADPPDAAERNRNEIIFTSYQHNRNPFIDRPEWVDAIWNDDDSDGVSNTDEAIAGTNPGNANSVFQASLAGSDLDLQIGCGLLSSGSTWRLYQGLYTNGGIHWRQVAQTNRLQGGALRFDILPTNSAAFYHLRATRP